MPRIVETIVTTTNAKGEAHIAPLGLIEDGENWIIAPFRPSTTLDNLTAGAVRGGEPHRRRARLCRLRDGPQGLADAAGGARARCDARRRRFALGAGGGEGDRRSAAAALSCSLVHEASNRPWEGFNRAQAAVLECAVLTTRLKMLPPEKIDAELKYLEIAISKTAGLREEEAWGWLMEKIAAFRAQSR